MSGDKLKLSVIRFGAAFGITWALGVLILGIHAILTGQSVELVELMGSIYIGYEANWGGTLIGTLWGFLDGFVCGLIFAWLYNCLGCCKGCSKG